MAAQAGFQLAQFSARQPLDRNAQIAVAGQLHGLFRRFIQVQRAMRFQLLARADFPRQVAPHLRRGCQKRGNRLRIGLRPSGAGTRAQSAKATVRALQSLRGAWLGGLSRSNSKRGRSRSTSGVPTGMTA